MYTEKEIRDLDNFADFERYEKVGLMLLQ